MKYSFRTPEANLLFSLAIGLEKASEKLEKERDMGKISNDNYLKIKFSHFEIVKKTREELEANDNFFPKNKFLHIENIGRGEQI